MWQLVEHYYSQNYSAMWLANFFHSWPHISYNGLKRQNPTFDPSNDAYVQSLIFWAGVPILWLLLTLMVSLIFSCCLCCRRRRMVDPASPRPAVRCPQRFLIISAFCCLGLLGVGYYGNEASAIGVHHFVNSADEINETVTQIDYKINQIEDDLDVTIPAEVEELETQLQRTVTNQTVLEAMLAMTEGLKTASQTAAANLADVLGQLSHSGLDASVLLANIMYYDYFRWMGIILLLTFQLVTCLLIILAASRASRYLLVLSSILCIVCLLIIWCMVAAELFAEIGMSDLCVDPNRYLISEAAKRSEISEEILRYYIECSDSIKNPFSSSITQANNQLAAAQESLASLEALIKQYSPSSESYANSVNDTLKEVIGYTQQVTALVDCNSIHRDYISAVHGICYDTLAGTGFLLLSGVVLGLVLTLVLCMSSTLASRIARRKINYEVDQEDPFLPPQTSSATLERFRRRGHDSADSARETPPPLAPISPTRPQSSHGFGSVQMPSPPRYHRYEPPFHDISSTRPSGRASYVSHQRDSFLEDPASSRGVYDSPPPSYTMAMRRDGNRRNHNQMTHSEQEEQNERNRNRLSAGSASLV
ncbi:protein tweety homolog 1-A-like isoform X3 [Diadema antillarum]|uniref:protein tweety homolog 1-A-like isoform X3 n=1 Tax=Diadema antillarum TaxID=105358 RepID=UPI003A8C0C3B